MSLTIYAVGDVMLGEQALCYNFGVKSVIKNKGVNYLFKDVKDIFRNGDIVFGNLEAPISNHTDKNGFEANFFRAEPNVIEGLKNANFNVLSVANNHIMEHGDSAFLSTVSSLKENNITPVGVANKTEILEIDGFKIAIIGYSFIDDFIDTSLYNKINSERKILGDIKSIRDSVDLVILSLHWGYEYIPFPSPEQVEIGRKLIDCGADIIFGGHPHVIQSYEIYRGKPIVYSLGNFIFDHTYMKSTRKAVIAKIKVDMNTKDIDIDFIPVVCDSKEYCPKVADGKDRDEILNLILSVRGKIENKSLSDYRSVVGGYLTFANRYKRKAKMQMKMQFIKNMYRYPPNLSISMVNGYLQKRFR
ncbi:Capsule biosynthesis protein [ANME-1 cluster archaeon GoMg3.2]|nr:Capsule biosynthesis protein [ANME-1 cluster archaeon GoMg3.2]